MMMHRKNIHSNILPPRPPVHRKFSERIGQWRSNERG